MASATCAPDDRELRYPGWFLAFLADRAIRKPSAHTAKAYRQDFMAIATLLVGDAARTTIRGRPTCSRTRDTRRRARPRIYAILKEAHERATAAGAKDVEERPVVGAPVDALVELAEEVNADLLVVGNVGLSTITGRLLGSVPANVSRKAKTDVLIVHTTN